MSSPNRKMRCRQPITIWSTICDGWQQRRQNILISYAWVVKEWNCTEEGSDQPVMLIEWRRNNLRRVITRGVLDSEIILQTASIIICAKGLRAFNIDGGDRSCLRDKSTSSGCTKAFFHLAGFGNVDPIIWKKFPDERNPEKDDRIAEGEPAPVFGDWDSY
jgi:hypothetical protein